MHSLKINAIFSKKILINKSVQPSKNGNHKNIQGFSKRSTNACARSPKPVVTQEGRRSPTCSKQQKFEIVLPNNQRALFLLLSNQKMVPP